jgi:pimeloyl-ACP methyl ester carboxylesterase
VIPAAAQPALLLLHGMFSGSADWQACAVRLATHWRVIVPDLPVLDLPHKQTGVPRLVDHVERLLDQERIDHAVIAGNSLGGHVALSLALRHPGRVAALILAGSSGLSKRGFQSSVPRRPSREWVDRKIREVFFEGRHVTPHLVDEVFGTVTDARLAMKAVRMARSAKHENLGDSLDRVHCPVLLVWGNEDRVTPPAIACEFKQRIPHAELHFIPRCGHSPNIEQPEALSLIVEQFLQRNFSHAYAAAPA